MKRTLAVYVAAVFAIGLTTSSYASVVKMEKNVQLAQMGAGMPSKEMNQEMPKAEDMGNKAEEVKGDMGGMMNAEDVSKKTDEAVNKEIDEATNKTEEVVNKEVDATKKADEAVQKVDETTNKESTTKKW